MAEEKGDKNVEISDSDKKLDALCDMLKDACVKMDEGGKRLDARMDAMEERAARVDARLDAVHKDEDEKTEEEKAADKARRDEEEAAAADKARRDAEEAGKEKGDPKQVAADKVRKDAEDKEKSEKAEADKARRDAEEKTEKEKEEAHADSAPMTVAEAKALRAEIAAMQARAPSIISDADRERFAAIQEQADPVFQAFNDRAPAPMDGETPTQYKRRLGSKLQSHSPRWKDARLSAAADEGMLDTVLGDIYADSMTAARRGADIPKGQLRARERTSGGHTIIEYDGDTEAWMNPFAGNSQRGTGAWLRPH